MNIKKFIKLIGIDLTSKLVMIFIVIQTILFIEMVNN